jgi:hypothetical protein
MQRRGQDHVNSRIWIFGLSAATLLMAGGGCKMAALPWLMWGEEPTRKVTAEYPYLDGKRICVLIWTDSNTLFEYPYVRLELSEHVQTAMKPNIARVSFIPNRDVVDYQQANPDWDREDPTAIGARFRAERVMLIELTHYTTREPDSPHLLRGLIASNVKVYDAETSNTQPLFSTTIESIYPEGGPASWGTDESDVRRATMEDFAIKLARKFHDHRVKGG